MSFASFHRCSAGWQLLQKHWPSATVRKDDFIATLGHELRNPLGAIVAATEALQQRMSPDSSAQRALDIIVRQSHCAASRMTCSTSRASKTATRTRFGHLP